MDKEIPEERVVSNQETTKLKSAAIKRKWNHFIDNSTLHGMQYVFNGQTKVRSIIWAFFLLGGMVYFSFQSSQLLRKYFRYPVTTKQTVEYENSPKFPAVTICNFNMLTKSYSEQVIQEELLKYFFRAKIKEFGLKANRSAINWSDFENVSMENIYYIGGHQMKNMIEKCVWSGNRCDYGNFTRILTSMGLCHTFNSGKFI